MNTRMQFEMMEKALPYAAELMDCKEMKDFKASLKNREGVGNGELMQNLMPLFLSKKPDVVFGMLGALNGKTAEEIAEQDWEQTRLMLKSPIINDLFDFFTFSVRMARNS